MRIRVAVPDEHVTPEVIDPVLESVVRVNQNLIESGQTPTATELVRKGEQHQIHGSGVAPVRFHRGNLCRLVRESVQSMLIAEQQLHGAQHGEHADAHAHHGAAFDGELLAGLFNHAHLGISL